MAAIFRIGPYIPTQTIITIKEFDDKDFCDCKKDTTVNADIIPSNYSALILTET